MHNTSTNKELGRFLFQTLTFKLTNLLGSITNTESHISLIKLYRYPYMKRQISLCQNAGIYIYEGTGILLNAHDVEFLAHTNYCNVLII